MLSIQDGEKPQVERPKPRAKRSKLAKPLITSLGAATLVASSAYVILAAAATGSTRPSDWTRVDWSRAVGNYGVCMEQARGFGVVGCMLRMGTRPVLAAAPATNRAAPIYSVAMMPDPAPTSSSPAKPGSAHSSASANHAGTASRSPSRGHAWPSDAPPTRWPSPRPSSDPSPSASPSTSPNPSPTPLPSPSESPGA